MFNIPAIRGIDEGRMQRFEVIELKGAEGLKRGFAEMVKGV